MKNLENKLDEKNNVISDQFNEKINNLEKIVKELENGDVALDDAINKFNEAIKLANSCNKTLEEATKTVNKVLNKEGNLEDFEKVDE